MVNDQKLPFSSRDDISATENGIEINEEPFQRAKSPASNALSPIHPHSLSSKLQRFEFIPVLIRSNRVISKLFHISSTLLELEFLYTQSNINIYKSELQN